jgi:hypothetical protein
MKKMRAVAVLTLLLAIGTGVAACGNTTMTTTSFGTSTTAPAGEQVPLAANTWTEIEPSGAAPSARSGHAMVYDSTRDQVILFGGSEGIPGLNDTWAYDRVAGTWKGLEPSGALPPARAAHTLVYDPKRDRAILFGGGDLSGGFDDIWAYDPASNTWSELAPSGSGPSPRSASLVYDSTSDQMILFGGGIKGAGIEGAFSFHDDTWAYDPAANAWTELQPSGAVPTARMGHVLIYDPVNRRVILFGGWDGETVLNDTWAYDPAANTWTELHPVGEVPAARSAHCMVYDSRDGKGILFGGMSLAGFFGDTWAYDPASDIWTLLDTEGALPIPRATFSMVYDQAAGEAILFGGATILERAAQGTSLNDTWAYRLAGTASATVDTDTSEWVTFEGRSVSLALPDTFVGGDPNDPEVLAVLAKAQGSPGPHSDLASYDLLMADGSNFSGVPADVQVFVPAAGPTPAMPDLLDQFLGSLEQSGLQDAESIVEEVTDDRAYIDVRFSLAGVPGAQRQHFALLRGDSWMCVVIYTFDDPSNTALEEIFRQSSETIVVKALQ